MLFVAHGAGAEVIVSFRDGDPHDRLRVRNTGCAALAGTLRLDLTRSAGAVIADTLRGGPGTKDPMPVEVESGAIAVDPVADGAEILILRLTGLPAGGTAVVTLDLDDTRGWWDGPRVEVFEEEMAGAVVEFADTRGVFWTDGMARLLTAPCAQPQEMPEDPVVPMV